MIVLYTDYIDSDENNPPAKHVYEKARFKIVGDYDVCMEAFKGSTSRLLVKILQG